MFSHLRHGLTSLRRAPTLAVTITLTLGLALAAAVIVFSFLNSFLLRPLPYGDASRIAVIYEHSVKTGPQAAMRVAYGNFADIQERATSFSRLALWRNESVTVHNGDATEVAFVQRVTGHAFPLIGARPALGALISPANLEISGTRTVLLSDSLWRRRFGADASIVGRTVRLDNDNYHVVGVMPADFRIPTGDDNPQAWLALTPAEIVRTERTQRRHHVWAELAPGRSLASANAELDNLAASLRREYPSANADRAFVALSLRDDLLGNFGRNLLLLQAAVLLVLVVACFNCFCLLIARAIQRRREFAVRLALGAAHRHLFAQLFTESLWLALPAALFALALADFALPFGAALLPSLATVNSLAAPRVDLPVVASVLGAAGLVALAFSAVPLLQTRRLNLESTLREGGRSAGSASGAKAARVLAAGQIAVALALLICAALLVRSQHARHQVDLGFPAAEFDMFRVGLRGADYASNPARRLAFFDRVIDNVRALPGVQDVALANFVALPPGFGRFGFIQEGDGLEISDTPKRGVQRAVSPNFFQVFGLKLLAGRFLNEDDTAGKRPVVVVNAALAARHWPGESPLGRRVHLEGRPAGEWFEIVGIVSDVLGFGHQPATVDGFYATLSQYAPPGLGMGFYIRHRGVPPDERSLQRAVWDVDPDMSFYQHVDVPTQYAESAWQSRFVTQLVVAFALLAVALSLAGIYAVNAFFVARRTNEFGIRAALGATRTNLLTLVLRDNLRLTIAGLAAGVLLAFAATRALTTLLYNVPPLDVPLYAAAALAMTLACIGATLLPARRAAQVDPLTALRSE